MRKRVLFVTEKDAVNEILGKIADAFWSKGYCVILYAPFFDEIVLRFFSDNIERRHISDLKEKDLTNTQLLFCATLSDRYLPEFIFNARIPIYTYNYMMNRQVSWGGDVCFAPSVEMVMSDYDKYLHHSYVGIGDPKFDNIGNEHDHHNNRILFVDSGHFPFSSEGKEQIAFFLLDLCNKYPKYEIRVKPRNLKTDKTVTHMNSVYLYEVINKIAGKNIPTNLVFSEKRESLEDLIRISDTVLCLYSTAFAGAVAAGKGLVILEGFKSEDVYDVREKNFFRTRQCMELSGALCDYRTALKLLPKGIITTDGYKIKILNETDMVANKITEVCEYLCINYFSKDLIPRRVNTTYMDFRKSFEVDPNMSWEKLITNRRKDFIFVRSMILMDFHMKAVPDVDFVLQCMKRLEDSEGDINDTDWNAFMSNQSEIRDSCIIHMKNKLLDDEIDVGILLNALYLKKRYKEIACFPRRDISAFDLYSAFVAYEYEKDKDKSLRYLKSYFKKTEGRQFCKEISDMSDNRKKAEMMLFELENR